MSVSPNQPGLQPGLLEPEISGPETEADSAPDIVSFGSLSGGWSDTVDELGDRYDIEPVEASDLAWDEEGGLEVKEWTPYELEDAVLRVRPSSFFSSIEEEYEELGEERKQKIKRISERTGLNEIELFKQETWAKIQKLNDTYGLEFTGDPHLKEVMENKERTKEVYDEFGVRTAESYDIEEAYRRVRNGDEIIAKPQDMNQGDGVELLESDGRGDVIDKYIEEQLEDEDYSIEEVEDNIEFEEYIDITDPENVEKRMYFVGDEVFVSKKEHPKIEDGFRPQNTHNGGEYTEEAKTEDWSRGERKIYEAGRRFGGIHAVDYIDPADGEPVLIEDNGNPGHGTDTAVKADIPRYEEQFIKQKLERNTEQPERRKSARPKAGEEVQNQTATV